MDEFIHGYWLRRCSGVTGLGEGHYLGGVTLQRLFTVLSILLLSTAAALIQSCTLQLRDDAGANAVAAQMESKRKACSSLDLSGIQR